MVYVPPLHVYIVHHPEASEAKSLADDLALWFTGDPEAYSVPQADVPTFIWAAQDGSPPPGIPFGEAARTVVVLIVDDNFVADTKWREWAVQTAALKGPDGALFLVALTRNAFNLGDPIVKSNAVRLYEFPPERWQPELRLTATRNLTRLLLDGGTSSIFISHAKSGGLQYAEVLRDYLKQRPLGETFFDSVSIEGGEDFEEKLRKSLASSVVVVVLTDLFAGRYWCAWEVWTTKMLRRPMLLVDALKDGERTSLKYGGNTRTIRWDPAEVSNVKFQDAIAAAALLEQLRHQHNLARVEAIGHGSTLPSSAIVLGAAPELAGLPARAGKSAKQWVYYPDPPLSTFEAELIQRHRPDVESRSLTQVLAGVGSRLLARKRIALSISDAPDRSRYGTSKADQERLWNRLAAILLAAGAELAYGGDLRTGGYTDRLWDLIRGASSAGARLPRESVHSYLGWPIHLSLATEDRAAIPSVIRVHELPMPAALGLDAKTFVPPDVAPANSFAWSASMSEMRSRVASECDARILVGGQLRSASAIPGLVDELMMFLERSKPVYLVGAFGGMTRVLLRALQGDPCEELTREYQADNGKRAPLLDYYQARAKEPEWKGLRGMDFAQIVADLETRGLDGLDNGLSGEENRMLATSKDLLQITALIMKGLRIRLAQKSTTSSKPLKKKPKQIAGQGKP